MSGLRCGIIIHPSYEGSPDVECGKPARRRLGLGNEGVCDDCLDEMVQSGDFPTDEIDQLYPLVSASKEGGK